MPRLRFLVIPYSACSARRPIALIYRNGHHYGRTLSGPLLGRPRRQLYRYPQLLGRRLTPLLAPRPYCRAYQGNTTLGCAERLLKQRHALPVGFEPRLLGICCDGITPLPRQPNITSHGLDRATKAEPLGQSDKQ
jgi:hypothetical protein